MSQPARISNGDKRKPRTRSKTVKKRKPTVGELVKKSIERSKKPHPEYGTSKLEKRFAKEFLDKLGVRYEEQFEAKDIKRFYDFYLPDNRILLEIDGTYWHAKGKKYDDMNPTQKRNNRVDKIKNEWAQMRGIPLIRIWEDDINKNPEKVMKLLREEIGDGKRKSDGGKRSKQPTKK